MVLLYVKMDDLLELYNKYIKSEYTIEDVSRILSYAVFDGIDFLTLENSEYEIEKARFTVNEVDQKKIVCSVLKKLISQAKTK